MGLFSSSSSKGAKEQQAAIREGQELARGQLSPVGDLGLTGYREQAALLGLSGDRQAAFDRFYESPGIQFQQEEAQRAVLRGSSAMGGLVSGNTLAALQERSQGLAGQQFNNYLSQLGQFSSPGLQARSQLANIEVSTASELGQSAFAQYGGGGGAAGGIGGALGGLFGGSGGTSSLSGLMGMFGGGTSTGGTDLVGNFASSGNTAWGSLLG